MPRAHSARIDPLKIPDVAPGMLRAHSAVLDRPAGWWYRPEFIINELNINAAITSPAHDESLPLTPNDYTIRGYAYTG